MDLQSLNTFVQVAELSNFTKAAKRLGFSQPTVSFQIKQLENELGVSLFDRVGRTVRLTCKGREVLAYAQNILRMSGELLAINTVQLEPSGLIRLAMADSLCNDMIIKRFASFRACHPQIDLKVTSAGTEEMFRLLDHNEVDIVCTLDNHIYNNNYHIAYEEKIGAHLVCSVDNPLARTGRIKPSRLMKEPFILTEKGMSYRRLLDEFMAKNNLEITPVLEVGSADMICTLVEAGLGVSFLPDYVTKEALEKGTIVRLEIEGLHVELWKQLLYHRDKWISPQMEAVIEFCVYSWLE